MKATIMGLSFADIERIAFNISGYIEDNSKKTSFSCNVFYDDNYIDHNTVLKGKIEDICFDDFDYPYSETAKDAIKEALYNRYKALEDKYSFAFSKANEIRRPLVPYKFEKNKDMIIAFINEDYDVRRISLPCRVLNEALSSNADNSTFVYNIYYEREILKKELIGNINKVLKEPDYWHTDEDWKSGLLMAGDIIGELL